MDSSDLEEGCEFCPETQTIALVHGDLATEHVLYDPTKQIVTGIIDWTEIAIGDIAVDLAGVYHWGGRAFVDAVIANYVGEIDHAALARARYLAACRGVADIAFGLQTGRQEYAQAGIRALKFCVN